mmetsp:Transcript_10697/g.22730  ORF Transcript_10697/g.22730 Transcript_10697/m.22730 type:complete len:182 (+) Transcript_10697:43-588(+)
MSTLSVMQTAAATAGVLLIGTVYVLLHERRRKAKALRRAAEGSAGGSSSSGKGRAGNVTREKLLTILEESSTAAYQLIEQTRKMVFAKHEQTGMSVEQVVNELQKDFEQAMETVVFQIRKNHGVNEEQMTKALIEYQSDPTVGKAFTTLREAMSGQGPPPPPPQEQKRVVQRKSKPRNRKG